MKDLLTVRPAGKYRSACHVVYGQPVEAIVAFAKQNPTDMIILGASAHSAFNPRFIPGIAYRVLCEAPCPVLVLKEESATQSVSNTISQVESAHVM